VSTASHRRGCIGAALLGLSFTVIANTATSDEVSQVAQMYALDFVGTAATGYDLNDAGDVVGKSYTDPGCGPFCLPPEEIVVWRGGNRIVLPLVPGFSSSYQHPFFINNQGMIGGEVGIIGSTTHVALWTPNGTGYTAQDMGVLPGISSADFAGIDDEGRMVGTVTVTTETGAATGNVQVSGRYLDDYRTNHAVTGTTNAYGTDSFDPDGTIVAYRWAGSNGSTLATQAAFTRTYTKSGKYAAILYVTDDGGRTASKTVKFTVLR
jgi:hypothetical protein